MSYRNPVYPRDFADPFVLKYRGDYWAYSTGFQPDGGVFGILRSVDLVHWKYVGSAMRPLVGDHPCYWAPEVTYEDDGSFLMYYSVGNEENMVIRVARSSTPEGPFSDVGVALTTEPFAIDAHVFKDSDGSRYLFYATDFLRHTHIGTGTVVARMNDPFSLAGEAQPVTRAKYEWQVYDPKRESKGGVKWHTVEGPFVLKRKGIYYEMFSGGNWQNITYGVSFATSDKVLSDSEWDQNADGEKLFPILRTVPGKVIGPGHNSVVRGPNNRDLYCVYHEWVNNERVLAIDPLDWRGRDMILLGPTISEQPGPSSPKRIPLTESAGSGQTATIISLGRASCLVEFWVELTLDGSLTLSLESEDNTELFEQRLEAGPTIPPTAWINVRIELDGCILKLTVGDNILGVVRTLTAPGSKLHIRTAGSPHVTAIELTRGWEESFDAERSTMNADENYLALRGWQSYDWNSVQVTGKELLLKTGNEPATILKSLGSIADREIVVNARLESTSLQSTSAEIIFGDGADETIVTLAQEEDFELARITHKSATVAEERFSTPPGIYHQIRIRYALDEASISVDGMLLSTVQCSSGQQLALRVTGSAAFDMVRVTELDSTEHP